MSADLVAFLRARLDEDEAYALTVDPSLRYYAMVAAQSSMDGYPRHYQDHHATDLMHRHDPARVLRQVEAGRAILHEFETFTAATENMDPANFDDLSIKLAGIGIKQGFTRALGHLAAIYRDHEDYREEWAL